MTPEAVRAGEYDSAINAYKEFLPDDFLNGIRSSPRTSSSLTFALVCALLQRRENFLITHQGNRFTDTINTSLSALTIPPDMWMPGADVSIADLEWLLVRGACIPYLCWQRWGIAGGQRVRELVDMIVRLLTQTCGSSFQHDRNGWFWGHCLHGILMGGRHPDMVKDKTPMKHTKAAQAPDDGSNTAVASSQTSRNNPDPTTPARASTSNPHLTKTGASTDTTPAPPSSVLDHKQHACKCRTCLALFVVDAGAAHEAGWYEEFALTRNIGTRTPPPPALTMLDALKMEYNIGHHHDIVLAHLLSRIPAQTRKTIHQVAKVSVVDPIILNYVYRGGVLYEHMKLSGFSISFLKFHEKMRTYRRAITEISSPSQAAASQEQPTSVIKSVTGADIDDLPLIRCSDVSSTLGVMKELVETLTSASIRDITGEDKLLCQEKRRWHMAVDAARFWLDIELEGKKSIQVTIDGHTTWMPVTKTLDDHLLSGATVNVAVLTAVLMALCQLCGVHR